jgi:hypothetical protein
MMKVIKEKHCQFNTVHSEARLQRPATKNLLKVLSRKLQIYAL